MARPLPATPMPLQLGPALESNVNVTMNRIGQNGMNLVIPRRPMVKMIGCL